MINYSKEYAEIKEKLIEGVQQVHYEAREQQANYEQKRVNQRISRSLKEEIEERLKNENDFVVELNNEQYEALTDSYQKGDYNNFHYLQKNFYNNHCHIAKVELGGQEQGSNDEELSFNKVIHVTRV